MGNKFEIEVNESQEELKHRLHHALTASSKERLQMLYWLKNNAIASSQELLTQYSLSEDFAADLTTAFGSGYDSDAAQELVKQWQTGEFTSFPEIEIRSVAIGHKLRKSEKSQVKKQIVSNS